MPPGLVSRAAFVDDRGRCYVTPLRQDRDQDDDGQWDAEQQ
jgi:hypothetical protein